MAGSVEEELLEESTIITFTSLLDGVQAATV